MTESDTEAFWRRTLALVDQLDSQSYYQLLGVATEADSQAISDAYYMLVRTVHPDLHASEPDPARRNALVRLYARIGEAYRVLRSDKRRRVYDAELAAGKTRLARDAEQRSRVESAAPDPRTPHARKLYEHGVQLIEEGDRKAGRAELNLAAQFEPDSKVIRAALDALAAPAATPAAPSAPDATDTQTPAQVRAPQVTMRCATWDQVVALGARIAGGERIFLRTQNPPPKGTTLPVALRLPNRETLALNAIVAELVHSGKSGPGMRLAVQADDSSHDALERLIAQHKPPNTAALQAREALDAERYTDAREAFELALTAEPNDRSLRAGYYLALGHEALLADLRAEARIHFRTAQLLDESSTEAAKALETLDRTS